MVHGIDITDAARQLPPNKRVLIWSNGRWKPAKWNATPGGGVKPGMFMDCLTGPIPFRYWCHLPPDPEE